MKTSSIPVRFLACKGGKVAVRHVPDVSLRLIRLEETVRCAAEWLRVGAPGKALAALESSMT